MWHSSLKYSHTKRNGRFHPSQLADLIHKNGEDDNEAGSEAGGKVD